MSDKPLATTPYYVAWLKAVDARVVELNTTYDVVDQLAALPARYTAKLMARMKTASIHTFFNINGALGLDNRLYENVVATERLKKHHEFVPRKYRRPMRSGGTHKPVKVILTPDFLHEIARRGGHARAAKMTDIQRSRSARKAARARWQNVASATKSDP